MKIEIKGAIPESLIYIDDKVFKNGVMGKFTGWHFRGRDYNANGEPISKERKPKKKK